MYVPITVNGHALGTADLINSAGFYGGSSGSSLATVATTGKYTDLLSVPTKLSQFTNDLSVAPQVNADFSATSGVAQILNKPTKLSQFTNDLAVAPQVNADYSATSGVAQILNKPTKLSQFTNDLTAAAGNWSVPGTLAVTGATTVTGGVSTSTLSLTPSQGQGIGVISVLNPSLGVNSFHSLTMGQGSTANNLGQFTFNYVAKDSASNYISLGLYGSQQPLAVYNNSVAVTGPLTVSGSTQTAGLTNTGNQTIAGTLAVTGTTSTGALTASSVSTPTLTVAGSSVSAQVKADWNATSGIAQILNKPPVATPQCQSFALSGPWPASGTAGSNSVTLLGGYQVWTGSVDCYATALGTATINWYVNGASAASSKMYFNAGNCYEALPTVTWVTTLAAGSYTWYPQHASSGVGASDSNASAYVSVTEYTLSAAASQINTDWNATSGLAQLLNKPTKLSQFTNDLSACSANWTVPGTLTASTLSGASLALTGAQGGVGALSVINPNMGVNSYISLTMGLSSTSNNLAQFSYTYVSNGSASNCVTLGLYGSVQPFSVYASSVAVTGTLAVSSTLTTAGLTNTGNESIAGTLAVTGLATASAGVNIPAAKTLNFGSDQTKATNAGSIGYQLATAGALDVFGAGTAVGSRVVKLWDNVTVAGSVTGSSLICSGAGNCSTVRVDGTATTGSLYYTCNSGTAHIWGFGATNNNAGQVILSPSSITPTTDASMSIGASGNRWSSLYTSGITHAPGMAALAFRWNAGAGIAYNTSNASLYTNEWLPSGSPGEWYGSSSNNGYAFSNAVNSRWVCPAAGLWSFTFSFGIDSATAFPKTTRIGISMSPMVIATSTLNPANYYASGNRPSVVFASEEICNMPAPGIVRTFSTVFCDVGNVLQCWLASSTDTKSYSWANGGSVNYIEGFPVALA